MGRARVRNLREREKFLKIIRVRGCLNFAGVDKTFQPVQDTNACTTIKFRCVALLFYLIFQSVCHPVPFEQLIDSSGLIRFI